jgi:hypothetical protein
LNYQNLLEQNRQRSLEIWAQSRRHALHEAVRNTPVNTASGATSSGSGRVKGGLQLVWSSITNTPVADPTSVSDWNNYFGNSFFTSVRVTGNTVNLIPSGTVQFGPNLFSPGKSGNEYLIQIIDKANCVTVIDSQALTNCVNLTTVIIPACTLIAFAALFFCTSLVTVDFTSVEEVAELGLGGLYSLESLSMPALTLALPYAFYYTISMLSFSAPNLEIIGNNAFMGCVTLASISIPQCTNLGENVGNNNVFEGISGNTIDITLPAALMTCNAGDPDGDIIALAIDNTLIINGTPYP